jgi:hypothetical protein
MADATSSGRPIQPRGVIPEKKECLGAVCLFPALELAVDDGVSTAPGERVLTRIPRSLSSTAQVREGTYRRRGGRHKWRVPAILSGAKRTLVHSSQKALLYRETSRGLP